MDQAGASLGGDRLYRGGRRHFGAMALGEPPPWVVYAPLPPLFLLLFSGLYLFVLPHAVRWRGGDHGRAA